MRAPRISHAVVLGVALVAALAPAAITPVSAGPFTVGPPTLISEPSPFAGCDVSAMAGGGINYLNAEVEPWVAVNPTNPSNIIAVWQQDRWSNGGARGMVTAASHDGGATWTRTFAHFSTCAGGTPDNGGNYERASDPWVTFSPNGDAYQISLSVNFVNDPASAILVSKSTDGGDTWSEPVTLIRDGPTDKFNDKETITADPFDSKYVYAVWDRSRHPSDKFVPGSNVASSTRGDILFARTTDGGATWEPAQKIFRPQDNQATISNQIAVLADGSLVDMFQLLKGSRGEQDRLRHGLHAVHRPRGHLVGPVQGDAAAVPGSAGPRHGPTDPRRGRRVRHRGGRFGQTLRGVAGLAVP